MTLGTAVAGTQIVAQYAWRLLVNVMAGLWQICQDLHVHLSARYGRKVWGWYAIVGIAIWLIATGGAAAAITNAEVAAMVVLVRVGEALYGLAVMAIMLGALLMILRALSANFFAGAPSKRKRK